MYLTFRGRARLEGGGEVMNAAKPYVFVALAGGQRLSGELENKDTHHYNHLRVGQG